MAWAGGEIFPTILLMVSSTANSGDGVGFMINLFYLKGDNILCNIKSNDYSTTAFCPLPVGAIAASRFWLDVKAQTMKSLDLP